MEAEPEEGGTGAEAVVCPTAQFPESCLGIREQSC